MSYLQCIVNISFIACLCLFNVAGAMADDVPGNEPNSVPEWKAAYVPEGDVWKYTEQHLTFNNGTDPETLDPHMMTGLPEMRIAEALFEGLVTYDPSDLTPRPGVAESWDVSDDGLIYTFHLRKDAKWSDGKEVTALDFLFSWKRGLDPVNRYINLFFPIAGAKGYSEGKLTDFNEVGIHVKDSHTLEVVLHAPCPYFLDLVAFPTYYPVRVELIEKFNEKWTRQENIIGNGPFVLKEWSPREQILFEKNPYYWDRDFVKLELVTVLPISDLNTAYKLFQDDKLHWMPALPVARIEELKRNPDYYVYPMLGTYFYRFNVTKPPFDDVRVRKAFCLATDRVEICNELLKGGEQPSNHFCPPVAGYEPVEGLKHDIVAARKLLTEAGYGKDKMAFPKLEVIYNTSEGHKMIAEAISQQWKQNLGIDMGTRNMEWKVYLDNQNNLDYTISRSSWIGDYADPFTFFSIFRTDDGNNRTGWSCREYDELLDTVSVTLDRKERNRLFNELEKLLVEQECPVLPIYDYVNKGLIKESVLGWEANIRDVHPLKYIWRE